MASSSEKKVRWSPCCCTCIRLKIPAGADFAHMECANCCAAWVQTPPGRINHCGLYLRFKAQAALCPQSCS